MTNYNKRLVEITSDLWVKYGRPGTMDEFVPEAKQALTSLTKELVAEAIGEDESLVEVHKRNLVVASQFNAVIKSRNSLRHKQRQDLKNLLKELETRE